MFKTIRALVEALNRVNATLGQLVAAQAEAGPPLDRLEHLELSRVSWEAEVEGILLKAQGKEKAARSAEARTRTMRRFNEENFDTVDEDSVEVTPAIPQGYAPASEEEEVQPVRLGVAPTNKTVASKLKWGR